MAPVALDGVYAQYKRDTDTVAAWLAKTAKACGCDPVLLEPPPSSNAPAAPGSQATPGYVPRKKHAKKAATKTTASGPQKYIIAIKAFVPLAECIAAFQSPVVQVPESFSNVLKRVITVRSSFASQLQKGSKSNEIADEKHSYFVGILQKVRDVLAPRMVVAPQTVDDESEDVAQVTNLFGILRVYEPSQEFLDAPDITPPQSASKDEPIYEAETVPTLHEALVAYTMMVNDLNRIRSRIEWIWKNYRDGGFDLAVAAIATNTAIDLARNITESAASIFKGQDGGLWGMTGKFHIFLCLQKGMSLAEIQVPGKSFNYKHYDIANGAYLVAHLLLESFKDVLDPRSVPLYKEGMFGYYNPRADRSKMTGEQKFIEDQVMLMEFFTELMSVVMLLGDSYPIQDEFLRGMKELEKTHEVPFYLVFAAQIFLDIQHILRNKATMARASLEAQSMMIITDLKDHLKFHENVKIDHWPKSNDAQLRQLITRLEWFGTDPVYHAKIKTYERIGAAPGATMKPYRILDYSPVLCGLAVYRFRAEYYDVGLAVANAWGSIMYTYHLYNALKSEKLITQPWPDMEVVAEAIGQEQFFVGDRPRTSDECFQKFCLHMGVSATAFSNPKQRRKNASVASRAGPKGFKTGIPVTRMFEDRYMRNKGSLEWTAEQVERIVARSQFEQTEIDDEGNFYIDKMDAERLKEVRSQKKKKKDRAKGQTTDPQELIHKLAWSLQSETLEFAMPYLPFHRWCWRVLRILKEHLEAQMIQKYTPAYMERESELPFLVGYILMAASKAEGHDVRLLEEAGGVLKSMIAVSGSMTIEKWLRDRIGIDISFETEAESDGAESLD